MRYTLNKKQIGFQRLGIHLLILATMKTVEMRQVNATIRVILLQEMTYSLQLF